MISVRRLVYKKCSGTSDETANPDLCCGRKYILISNVQLDTSCPSSVCPPVNLSRFYRLDELRSNYFIC